MSFHGFKNYLKRNPKIVESYHKVNDFFQGQLVNPKIGEVEEINARALDSRGEAIRLNLIIPSVDKRHVFGGIATAIRFFEELINELAVDTRIIVTDSGVNLDTSIALNGYTLVDCSEDSCLSKQLVSFADRHNKTIPVAKNDIFIATGWWTAYSILNVIRWQAKHYNIHLHKLIYFIQDYEPGFYAWSSRYLMADSTYRFSDIDTIAIFNSQQLKEYFDLNGYKFHSSFYFEPILNERLKHYLVSNADKYKRKKQILIYGRPSTPRNAFELIVASLQIWCKNHKDADEWTVLSAGESFVDIDLGYGVKLHSLGKLSLEEYGRVMLESLVGISLMVSPHPSYPPLEMSTFGIKTITNCYDNKDLKDFNENIISLRNCSSENIAEEISNLCNQLDSIRKPSLHGKYTGENQVFVDIIKQIKLCLKQY